MRVGSIRGRCALITTGFAGPSFVKGAFILAQKTISSRFILRIYSHTYSFQILFVYFCFVLFWSGRLNYAAVMHKLFIQLLLPCMSTFACLCAELESMPCFSLQHLKTTSNTHWEHSNAGSLAPASFGKCHFKSSSGDSLYSVQQRTHWRQTTASTPWTGRWERQAITVGASGRRTPVENVQVVRERVNPKLVVKFR